MKPAKQPAISALEKTGVALRDAIAALGPAQSENITSLLNAHLSALTEHDLEIREAAVKDAQDESFEEGKSDGYEDGHREALARISPSGQARIDMLATLRRLENDATCPFQSKHYRAIADLVEDN